MFFFSRDNLQYARDTFRKSAREIPKVPVKKKRQILPVKNKNLHVQIVTATFGVSRVLFRQKTVANMNFLLKMPVTILEIMAVKIWHWPLKFFEKVPVKTRKCT